MKTWILTLVLPLLVNAALPERMAPRFEVKDVNGKVQRLSDYKGHWVVLEWFNKDCPYVKKHYGSGNMQKLQSAYVSKGVKWLTVLSSKEGKQGYMAAADAKALFAENKSANTDVLLDTDGKMGRDYGAKTTPHMFVINPAGHIIYSGAIDDNDSSDPKTISQSKNYVAAALDKAMAGGRVDQSRVEPYGCSIKY